MSTGSHAFFTLIFYFSGRESLSTTKLTTMNINGVMLALGFISLFASNEVMAQNKVENTKIWEESQARKIVPEIRTFVTPQICDMKMLSSSRESFGPYLFEIKSIEQTFNYELTNYQNRALYRALKESDADAIIEPLFDSYVVDSNAKTLVIELSGFPVQYANFRPASSNEIDMIGVVYPDAITSVSVNAGNGSKQEGSSSKGK